MEFKNIPCWECILGEKKEKKEEKDGGEEEKEEGREEGRKTDQAEFCC